MIMKSYILPVQKVKTLLLLISFITLGFSANAQYKTNTEIGVLGGTSYYLGDLNTTHFSQSSAVAGLVFRKNIDRRITYKAELLYLNVKADDLNNTGDTIAEDRQLHFKSAIYELSGQIEFNFLPYETGNSLYPWTPFIYGGFSMFAFNPKAENKEGQWVDLQPLGTEGQGTTSFPNRDKYALTQFAIAMGGGFKIAVGESFNIILEYGTRKTFTDYLDDVSTTYPGASVLQAEYGNNAANQMSDPTGTHQLGGDQRGNPDKKDWYSYAGITLSFKLRNDTKGCNY